MDSTSTRRSFFRRIRADNSCRLLLLCIVLAGNSLCPAIAAAGQQPKPFKPLEPEALYDADTVDATTKELLRKEHDLLAQGDIAGAIEFLQQAANRLVQQRSVNFELWDNLAELYCAQARRESDKRRADAARANGVAMLREFRCAIQLWRWTPAHGKCSLPSLRGENPALRNGRYNSTPWGFVPNPDLTPLCYSVLCDSGFQNDSQRPEGATFEFEDMEFPSGSPAHWFEQDASNMGAIERVCKVMLPRLPKSR
jgi:hypothetical protein